MMKKRNPQGMTTCTQYSYEQVSKRIEAFKSDILCDLKTEITLDSHDLNSLCSLYYGLSIKERARLWLPYYEIRDNEILEEKTVYPAWFLPMISFTATRSLKYEKGDEGYTEISTPLRINGFEFPPEVRSPSRPSRIGRYFDLIFFVLSCDRLRHLTLDIIRRPYQYRQIMQEAEEMKEDVEKVIAKLNHIDIKNSYLIIGN